MKLALELKTSHQKLSIEKIMDSRNHSFNLPPAHLPSAVSEEEGAPRVANELANNG